MRRIVLALSLSLLPAVASAQAMLGGRGAPVASVGNEGQYYFNTANGNVYGPKSFGVWPTPPVTPIPGPSISCTTLNLFYNNAGALNCMSGTSWDDTNRSLTVTGATVTTSNPILNLTQIWSNAATTFTGLKFNVTDSASNAASILLDLEKGGITFFKVDKAGVTWSSQAYVVTSLTGGAYYLRNGATILSSPANATWQLGFTDAAAPVAQTLGVQGVATGTSNTAGADWTIRGSEGTGTGAGGSIIFQTAPAGAAGTTPNAFVDAVVIDGSGTLKIKGFTVATLPTPGTAGRLAYVTDQVAACVAPGAAITGGGAIVCPVFYNGVAWVGM